MKSGSVLQYCMVTRDYAHRADHDEDEAKVTAWDVWTDDNQALAAGVFGAEGEEEMEDVGSHAHIVGLEGQEGAVLVPSRSLLSPCNSCRALVDFRGRMAIFNW